MVPLCAGSRIISPEEFDPALANALGLNKDGNDVDSGATHFDNASGELIPWQTHSCNPMQSRKVDAAPISSIFHKYDPANGDDDLRGTDLQSLREYRDSLAITRVNIVREVGEICRADGSDYCFGSGLVLRLDKCPKPLEIGKWLNDVFYCTRFSATGINKIKFIASGEHRILLVQYDALPF